MNTFLKQSFQHTVYNSQLIKTVESLKAKRIIKKDIEISRNTGYSKSVVSNYLSGRVDASDKFIQAFESFYKVSVFENFNIPNKKKKLAMDTSTGTPLPFDKEEYYLKIINNLSETGLKMSASLFNNTENTKETIALLKEAKGGTGNNLANSVANHRGISSILGPYLQQLAHALAGKYGKDEHAWIVEMNTILHEHEVAAKLSRTD